MVLGDLLQQIGLSSRPASFSYMAARRRQTDGFVYAGATNRVFPFRSFLS